MSTTNIFKSAALAAALSITVLSAAEATQEDRVDCYAQVHESCYPGGGTPKCSKEDYNAALDICDTYVNDDGGASERPKAPDNLRGKMTKSDPAVVARLKAQLKRSFGKH
ncbi:MAG: hypothetical protein ACFCUW_16630 [Kiloniellaceae bacterium]